MKKIFFILFVISAIVPLTAQIRVEKTDYFTRGLSSWLEVDERTALGLDDEYISFNNLGIRYHNMGVLDHALEAYSRAIAIDPSVYIAWNNRGITYKEKGEFDNAINDYNMAIELLCNRQSTDFGRSNVFNNRGLAHFNKGNLDFAISDYNAAIHSYQTSNAFNNRGIAYYAKDEIDLAISDYSRALALSPNLAETWNNRGIAYAKKGDLDRAIADYTRAVTLNNNLSSSWNNRGIANEEKGEYDMALLDYMNAVDIADKNNNILDIFLLSWQFAGRIYNIHPYLADIVYKDPFVYNRIILTRDVLLKSIIKAEKARSTLGSRGAEIMASLIYQYYAGVDFEASFGSKEISFTYSEGLRSRGFLEQMGTEAALKLPGIDPEDAQKVRDLLRVIDNYQNLLSRINSQIEPRRYSLISADLTRFEETLATLDAKISTVVPRYTELRNPKPANLSQAQTFCGEDKVIFEYVIWDDSIEFKAPSNTYGQSNYTDRPSINSYCLVITKDSIEAVRLDPHFDYSGKTEALRSKLFSVNDRGMIVTNHEAFFEDERNALYDALIKPVLKHIPNNIENILIVPDSNLAFLPFDILRENKETRNLGEHYSITLSPSVSVSILVSQNEVAASEPIIAFGGAWYEPVVDRNRPDFNPFIRDTNNNRLAALSRRLEEFNTRGNAGEALQENVRAEEYYGERGWGYLAGTVAEIQGLERIATVPPTVIQGKDVSKRRVKELSSEDILRNHPIVHFACHGFFNDNLTPKAALVFSEVSGLIKDESDEDGYLSIDEIVLLDLNARMVMLSACETGLGNIKRGDGMSGLARAFMVAGAQNVGVSLWEIDDEATAQFMWSVYRKVIRENKSFRTAYRETKAEFRADTRWSHPYYWAAFTMYE